jgi:hypothetical protein
MTRPPTRPSAPPRASAKRSSRPTLETLADAEALNLIRIDALSDCAPKIAAAIEGCEASAPCNLPICAKCSCYYRRPLIRELVRIAKSYKGPHQIATIHLETIPAGSLATATIKRALDRLRKQFQRCGFVRSILVGGAEVGWDEKSRSWILHVHLLAIGVPEEAWTNLRAALRNSGTATPLKVQPLRDVERQVSYVSKFTTYHRPLGRDGGGRSPAVPLPPTRLAELAAWWARYRFEDFVFLYGARRRGGRIVPNA